MYKIYHFPLQNVSIFVNQMTREYYISNYNLNYDNTYSFTSIFNITDKDYEEYVLTIQNSGYSRSYKLVFK